MNAARSTNSQAPIARKKSSKKVATKKKASGKVPDMRDVLAAHNKVQRAEKIYRVAHEQSNGYKKVWSGLQADLSSLLEDVKKGQGRMF